MGYIAQRNIAPVWVGEFGTPNGATGVSDSTPGSGASATFKDTGYNAMIPPGDDASFGFQGTWNSSDVAPTGFTLNAAVCS